MRKKKSILIAFVLSLLMCLCGAGAVMAFADDAAAAWALDDGQSGVSATVNQSSRVATIKTEEGFVAGTPIKATYSGKVNFNEGVRFRYGIPSANSIDTDINGETREKDLNYLKFTALNSKGVGFEITTYALHIDAENSGAGLKKMQSDIVYINPAIEADSKYCLDGKENIETFDTYISTDKKVHSIDFHKEEGFGGEMWWFLAIDGITAMPVQKLSSVDLSDCDVTFEYYTKTKTDIEFRLYPADNNVGQFILDDFLTFGSDIRTEMPDDTIRYKIADKIAAANPGQEIRYREQFISTVGYDVRKPINIEYSYDVSNASAVWYAVGLGRPNVLETINKCRYSFEGKATGGYSDNIAAENDGIMFQTTTGLAQPTYRAQNNRKEGYMTNSPSAGYKDRTSMDLLTFIVKENGTDMYFNGTLIFDNLITKLSDFADNDYLAYPYFHFFEDNANTSKGNTVVIKGINAARRTDDTALKVTGGSNKSLTVGLDNIDNGDIKLYEYVDEVFTAVDSSLYSYDKANKTLTLEYGLFDGRAYEVYKFYARNNGGSEEIEVRFSDPELATVPPSFDKAVYYWKLKSGTEDLTVSLDLGTGEYVSFSGGGIYQSQFTYTPGEGTKATIVIKKEYLNGKSAGPLTYTVRTQNVEKEIFTATFQIVVNATGEPPEGVDPNEPVNPSNPNEPGNPSNGNEPKKVKKCGSSAAGASTAAAMALIIPSLAVMGLRRKNKTA